MSASSPSIDHPLTQALQALDPLPPQVVALSGGADSTAMLVACAQRWPGQVRAVHIHHGLQAAADTFAHHGEALCARWQVPAVAVYGNIHTDVLAVSPSPAQVCTPTHRCLNRRVTVRAS